MAGFTSLALAGALGFMAARRGKKDNQTQTAQQGQVPAPGPLTADGQVPTPPVVDPAAMNAQALGAANKQRKTAARGALGTRGLPKAGTMPFKGTPKSLVGY